MAASCLTSVGYGPQPPRIDSDYNRNLTVRRFYSFEQMGSDGGIGIDGAQAMREILASVDKEVPDVYFSECKPRFVYVAGVWQPEGSHDGPLVKTPGPVGIAVVEEPFNNAFYLDKVAVKREHQRRGIARGLFGEMEEDCPDLMWRANPQNPACGFYYERSTGHRVHGPWMVFWRGFDDGEKLERILDYAIHKEKTLFDRPHTAHTHADAPVSLSPLYV